MRSIKTLLGSSLLALTLVATQVPATEKAAPIHFGDITWESGSLITEILRLIVENGYGYPTDTLPGSTVSLEAALAKNDIQVIGEEWAGRSPAWVKAASQGKVFGLGDTVKGATEGWWVPEYVIKGDPERGIKPLAAGLKSVADLARYKDVFRDPEDVSAPFKAQYPELVAFFEKVDLPIDLLNHTLGQMSEKRLQPRQVAEAFLRDQPQVWKAWVPGEVAERVTAQL
jgi:ABC-type proline/glycine betaine transport system substrate-binding protein